MPGKVLTKLMQKKLFFINWNAPTLKMSFTSSKLLFTIFYFDFIERIFFCRTVINWQPKSFTSKATSEHAVHIHQYGTIENENGDVNCDGSGPHFYESNQGHGKPENTPPER